MPRIWICMFFTLFLYLPVPPSPPHPDSIFHFWRKNFREKDPHVIFRWHASKFPLSLVKKRMKYLYLFCRLPHEGIASLRQLDYEWIFTILIVCRVAINRSVTRQSWNSVIEPIDEWLTARYDDGLELIWSWWTVTWNE